MNPLTPNEAIERLTAEEEQMGEKEERRKEKQGVAGIIKIIQYSRGRRRDTQMR